LTEDAARM